MITFQTRASVVVYSSALCTVCVPKPNSTVGIPSFRSILASPPPAAQRRLHDTGARADMVDDGVEVTAVYVTDYSWIDWETSENTERKKMPAPTAPDTFVDATDFTYAVETDVMGGMRPDLILFSETEVAVGSRRLMVVTPSSMTISTEYWLRESGCLR